MAENPFLEALDKFSGAPRKSRRLSAAFAPTPETEPEDTQEDKASLARRIGEATAGGALGFAGAVGNGLDLIGSSVRDVIHSAQTGEYHSPFDQWLTPFSDENRTTGRDLLRHAGLADQQDTLGNFFGGVGVEMATDPLSFITGPFAKSLSAGGRALKAAGLSEKMTRAAASKLGRSWGKVGPRMAALSSTANEILSAIDDPLVKAAKTAEVESHLAKRGASLATHGDQASGGLFGVGLPFMEPLFTVGSGTKSKAVADTLDSLGRGIQHANIPGTNFAPLNELARLFDPTIKEASSVEGQAMGREAYRHAPANEATSGLAAAELAQGLNKAGLGDEQADLVRTAAEQRNRAPVSFGPNRAKVAAELAQALPGEAPERHAAMLAGWDNKAMTWATEQGKSPDDWYARTFAEIRDQSQAHRVRSGAMPQAGKKLTKAQADLVEWATDPMRDHWTIEAPHEGPGMSEAGHSVIDESLLPRIENGSLKIDHSPTNVLEDFLYRVREQTTDMAYDADTPQKGAAMVRVSKAVAKLIEEELVKRGRDMSEPLFQANPRSWSDILDSSLKQAPLNVSPTGKLAESSVKGNDLQTRLRKIYSAMHKHEGNPNAQARLKGMAEQTINQLEDMGEKPLWTAELSPTMKQEGGPNVLHQANLPSGAKGAAEFVQHAGVRKAILTMLGGADVSTGIHEGGHAVENVLKEMGPDLYEKAARAVGATDPTGKPLPVGSWPRDASEDFARQLERYHFDGTVPSPELEKPFKALSEAMREVYKQTVGTPIAKDVDPLLKFVFDEAYSRGSRKLGGAWHALNTGGKQALEKFYQGVEELRLDKQDWGTGGAELSDPTLAYVHRQMTEGTSVAGGKPSQPFTAQSRTKLPREGYLTEIEGGTATINRMSRDAELGKLIDGGASRSDVAKYLKKTYGHLASETYKEGKQVRDRWKAMAGTIAKMTPEERAHGLFGNHMAADAQAGYRSALDSHTMGKTIIVGLAQPGVIQGINNAARVSDKSVKLRSLFKEVGLTAGDEKAGAVKKLLEHMRPQDMKDLLGTTTIDAAAIRKASHLRVDAELAADLMRMSQGVTGPDAAHAVMQVLDSASNLWKGWNTGVWPKYHMRNRFGGIVNNFMEGTFSVDSEIGAGTMLHGGNVSGIKDAPYIKQLAAQRGIAQLDDATATQLLGEVIYAYKAAGKYDAAGTVTSHLDEVQPATMHDMLTGNPAGQSMNWAKTGRKLAGDRVMGWVGGKQEGTHWHDLLGLRGVGGRTKSTQALAAAGDDIGYATEFLNRASPLIYLLKQGWDPGAAMKRIENSQVAYGARHFTKFENGTMARIVPFYKFGRKMLPWVLNELAEHPGGKLAQTIRLQHRSHSADEMTPDYIADTMSLPVGKSLDGGRRYVTSLGLMHEDPLQIGGALLSGDLRGAGLEAASRLNPAIKAPLEYITGQTFFQKGPQGGRPLEDLDPNLGRLLANVSGRKDAVRFPGSEIAELLLSNSPASSALTQARMLTDPRKSAGVKALKAGTGIGIADISEAQEEGIYRQRLQQEMKRMGSKKFLHTYFPKDKLATMSPGDRAFADWLLGEQTRLASNQKARSKEKSK